MALLPAVPGALGLGALVAAVSLLSAGALPLVEAITLGSLASGAARYGPIRLWGSVGFIAVVLAGGAWLDVGSVRVLPPALAAFSLLALAAAAGFPRARAPGPAGAGGFRVTRAAGSLIAAGFLMAAAHGALYAFLTLHLKRLGYSGSAIGVFWTLGVLAEIAVFACLPQLFRRFSLPQILLASLACAVVRFSIIGWAASELWLLVIAQLLHAATFGAFHAASVAAVQRIFPAGAHARGQALYSSLSNGAGGAAGVLAAGWGWQMGGAGTTFSLAALAAALGAYFAYRLKRSGF
jgi:PPP family 3-phenylpropionic acid transporter